MHLWTAKNIRDLRDKYGEKRSTFCHRVGVSQYTLRDWEQGVASPTGSGHLMLSRLEEDLREGKVRDLQPV